LLSDERSQTTLATAELYADGEVDKADLQNAKVSARVAANKLSRLGGDRPNVRSAVAWSAEATLAHAISAASITAALRASGALELAGVRSRDQEEREQLVLLRDIFGNPFRPVTFDPAWHTDTAVAIASGMYDSRDFSAMPILADALQDAGCENDDILNHCREANGIHVRGCWVVDLVLGKE
jgi:hypothetical protein